MPILFGIASEVIVTGMPKITFYGAARQVTGSCFLVEGENTTLLVDCGLFQGSRFASKLNYSPLPFACGQIDNILLTHAHIDHTGRVPMVCLEGFKGKIYATKPTLDLTRYLWEDALEIMEIDYEETGDLPLYSPKQAKEAMNFFEGVEYGKKIKLSEKDYAIFHDAGHIIGSAFIELFIDGKRIVFSGDVGNSKPPIIRETENLPDDIDLLVLESTYGHRNHEPKQEREKILFQAAKTAIRNKGVLMIPAFAIERTQEILYLFNHLIENKTLPPINIFLDSPLAIKATKIFQKYPQYYNRDDFLLRQSGDDLFDFPGLIVTGTRKQSIQINHSPDPKIIIAGSGMMSGGRITFHLQRYLQDPKNQLFIVGYQAAGTLGRKIFDGASRVKIGKKQVQVKASVSAVGSFSAHGDQKKLLSWMKNSSNIKSVCLTHGDEEKMPVFAEAIRSKLNIPVQMPKINQQVEI